MHFCVRTVRTDMSWRIVWRQLTFMQQAPPWARYILKEKKQQHPVNVISSHGQFVILESSPFVVSSTKQLKGAILLIYKYKTTAPFLGLLCFISPCSIVIRNMSQFPILSFPHSPPLSFFGKCAFRNVSRLWFNFSCADCKKRKITILKMRVCFSSELSAPFPLLLYDLQFLPKGAFFCSLFLLPLYCFRKFPRKVR